MFENETKDIRRIFSSISVIAPFAYPLLMMPIRFQHSLPSCAGTNGTTFICNYERWNELSFKEQMFVSMHEWIHVAMQHPQRMNGRNRRVFNFAADFVTNDMIISDLKDHFKVPEGLLYDYSLHNKSVEEVYNLLLSKVEQEKNKDQIICPNCGKDMKKQGQQKQSDSGNNCNICGGSVPDNFPQPNEVNIDTAAKILATDSQSKYGNDLYNPTSNDNQQLIDAIIKAAARAKTMSRGLLPGRYEEAIETLKKSEVPWERLLFRYAKNSLSSGSDRNPYKPDPKYLPFDVIVPTEYSNRIAKLVFIVDTSASMDRIEFEYVCGHLERLCTLVDKCIVITADTQVNEIVRVRRIKAELNERKIKFKGRGGTDMNQAFSVAESMRPDLIILYSDMKISYGIEGWPAKPKGCETIFLGTEGCYLDKTPYGVFIKVKNRK